MTIAGDLREHPLQVGVVQAVCATGQGPIDQVGKATVGESSTMRFWTPLEVPQHAGRTDATIQVDFDALKQRGTV